MASSLLENLPITTSSDSCKTTACKQTKPRRSWKEFIQRRNGTRVYVCNFGTCNKAFNYLSSLVKHERIHRGERPYSCKVCNQSFVQSSNLKRHEKTHTGEKSFECHLCQKMFSTASNLRQHEQIHKEEGARKHFNCDKCGREYLYPSSLSKHTKLCEGIPESDKTSQSESIEEPTLKKLVKVEEEKTDALSTETESKTQPEERSESSFPITFPKSCKILPEPTPLASLESALRNNLLLNCLPQPQAQPMFNFPVIPSNDQLLNSFLMAKPAFTPMQPMQQGLNGFFNTSLNLMSLPQPSPALLMRQQLQNRLLQQANFPLGFNRMSYF